MADQLVVLPFVFFLLPLGLLGGDSKTTKVQVNAKDLADPTKQQRYKSQTTQQ